MPEGVEEREKLLLHLSNTHTMPVESKVPAPHKVSRLPKSINPAKDNAQYFASLKSYPNFWETLPKLKTAKGKHTKPDVALSATD